MEDPLDNIDYSKYLFDSVSDQVSPGEALLGDSPNSLAIQQTKCEIQKVIYADKYIFFTLNAATELNKFEYNKVIKKVINKINEKKKLAMICQWYFEDKDKQGRQTRLHVHGLLQNVPETFYPYGGFCKYIAGEFHKLIGRKKVKHSVSSDVQWAICNEQVSYYCKKYDDKNFSLRRLLLPRLK